MNGKTKNLLFSLVFFSCVISCDAQNRFSALVEVGGASILSVNGEYAVWQNDTYQVNLRAGFGYIPESHFDFYSVPIGGNLVYKLKNRHHFETGAVVSYMHGFPASNSLLGDERLVLVGEGIYFSPSVGYRYDKWESGFVFRVSYAPLFVLHDLADRATMEADFESVYNTAYAPGLTPVELPLAENRFGFFSLSAGYRF